jgi:2'-hydroxyisoflavone reductase
MTTRRDFLKAAAAAGALGLVPGLGCAGRAGSASSAAGTTEPGRARRPLDLLILGGTGFIGPHLVRHAVSRGHRVTTFTRGRREADLPPEVTRLIGDRDGQLGALVGKRWDAVIDDSATNPDWVRQSTQLLKDSVGRYMFTSSTGVYYPYLTRGADETTALRMEVTNASDGGETYGVSKAQAEREVQKTFGERGVIVRPNYIVGPGDTTDRFPYWPVRMARGGEVLAPGKRDDQIQFIDVRDLVEFMVRLVETERPGTYNVTGPHARPTTQQEFLEALRAALNPSARLTWVDDYDFLSAHRIGAAVPWVMSRGNSYGHTWVKNDRAVAAGLTFRPIATTARDTLAWWATVPAERRANARFAITPERETAALAAWHARAR